MIVTVLELVAIALIGLGLALGGGSARVCFVLSTVLAGVAALVVLLGLR